MDKYDTLYKEIGTKNACEMLERIQEELQSIKGSSYHLSQRKNYRVKGHYGDFDDEGYMRAKEESKKPKIYFRKEEWMCKMCIRPNYQSDSGQHSREELPLGIWALKPNPVIYAAQVR